MHHHHLFATDPRLQQAITQVKPLEIGEIGTDIYGSLLRAIVFQQLSGKVAEVIYARFVGLFNEQYPEATTLAQMPIEMLRTVGLSNQKANYVKNIAAFSLEQNLHFDYINSLSDEELVQYLTQIKGVGRWTVEMLLIFTLQRPDVFPILDLGIRNAMIRLYEVEETGKAQLQRLHEIAAVWQPHRTLACRYLWRWYDSMK
ncbi:MAG: DNA-3-methyladenine glycosylase 2 family protein [Chitinophagales bacterium]|jgi:DNA-3-methyladenine glycosylase II|nr:DNA-3-methyladenine glycosylase 2 family protein [Chitinophagales bacterium]HNI44762.1 DNA-3-methyladenine glycosylase 2 family protein [Chitinophagales bacterium]HNL06245.1 DNA-3-methyladenine glycosylase 2 family protein [Chitinophagales bacterium]